VAEKPRLQVHVTGPARRDIAAIVKPSLQEFGEAASLRYEALILQALSDIGDDPERPGSTKRPEIMIEGALTYHLEFARGKAKGKG
jgi:plasmid stabilization system protein ParE